MEIFDRITPKEQETIKNYIRMYAGVAESAPLNQVLQVWNKQKRTLYKGLGKRLRVRIPVEIPRNALYYQKELKAIYGLYTIWDERDSETFLSNLAKYRSVIHNDFVYAYISFIAGQPWPNEDKYTASRLLLHQNIEKGYISTQRNNEPYHFKAFKATVKNNMRTVRTIQKVLKAMRFPYMDLFEEWRNAVSDLNINRDIKADLVFSIHPIDFMTMSDNNCDWSSCMSWANHGSYSAGTIEMMNSNMAVVAYLESKTPYIISDSEENYEIPNKSWRILLYANKHIIVAGKAYPYYNENLIKICLDKLRALLKENLNWKYQYINQQYRDNLSIDNNFYLQREHLSTFDKPKNPNKPKHAIYLYSNCMYNDLIEYKDLYWCCRNWVPHTMKFCISGPVTCMCCGGYIESPHSISSYDDIGDTKVCEECRTLYECDVCGQIKYNNIQYRFEEKPWRTYHICDDYCLDNLFFFPNLKSFYPKATLIDKSYIFFMPTCWKPIWRKLINLDSSLTYPEKDNGQIIRITVPTSLLYIALNRIKKYNKNIDYMGLNRYVDPSNYCVFLKEGELWENQIPNLLIQDYIKYIPAKERFINETSSTVSS